MAIDFDLAHPLSIVNLDGKVVISLKVRHKRLPLNLNRIQFARILGDITEAAANTDGTATFTLKTLQGALVEFNGNGNTIYTDVSSGTGVSGSFDGLKALAGTGAALAASNMNSDGSLYARRVWYADDIEKLPVFTPEGLGPAHRRHLVQHPEEEDRGHVDRRPPPQVRLGRRDGLRQRRHGLELPGRGHGPQGH